MNHIPRDLKLLLLFVNITNATTGMKVIVGIFVKIANPRKIPEIKLNNSTVVFCSLLLLLLAKKRNEEVIVVLLLLFWGCLVYIANNIDKRIKGNERESRSILLVSQLIGITANN